MPVYFNNTTSTAALNNILSGSGRPTTTPTAKGQLYLDTLNGVIYVSDGTSGAINWVPQVLGFQNRDFSGIFDDFYNFSSGQFWTTGGGTGSVSVITGTINGKISIITGAVATNTEFVADTAGTIAQSNTANKRLGWRVLIPDTTKGKIFIGETDTTATPDGGAANTIAFYQNSANAAPTHWYTYTNVAGTPTATDTGIVVSTSTYTKLEMQWDATGANVTFYINGVSAGSMPTMAGVPMNVLAFAFASGGAAAQVNVDYFMAMVPRS